LADIKKGTETSLFFGYFSGDVGSRSLFLGIPLKQISVGLRIKAFGVRGQIGSARVEVDDSVYP